MARREHREPQMSKEELSKYWQRIIQTHGYTVTLKFLGKRSLEDCVQEILDSHFQNDYD